MPELGSNLQQEISQLEQQLAEKRAALQNEALPEEKDTLHEVIGEKIQEQLPAYQPQAQTSQPNPADFQPSKQHDDSGHDSSYASPVLKDKVQELVNLVFNKSLSEGIKEVTKTGNPALIDAFHDVMTDHLYDLMVERKKVERPE